MTCSFPSCWNFTETISCHDVHEGNVLPLAEDITPAEDSIFFHETSCRGGLNSRQACAIESAARKHPHRHIYVFFNSPVSEIVLTRSSLAKLTAFKNLHLARLNITQYAAGTVLSEMIARNENNLTEWRIEHTADMLKFISMYKYGGLYIDMDVLVVKPLDYLGKNWAAREDQDIVNIAVLALAREGFGHELVSLILDEVKSNYRPDLWTHSGPGAMTRTLLRFCNTTRVLDLNEHICHGFKVYDPSVVYPIPWDVADAYFKLGGTPDYVPRSFTHHFWNKLSRDMPVEPGFLYDLLTRQHCPTIRNMYGEKFGS